MLGWIALGPPAVRAQELLITEFVAVNRESALDETGKSPDWIEVHNPGSSPVDLSDWFLTDDVANRRKWRLPSLELDAGGFTLIFASGEDRTLLGSPPHTNFKLSGDGEFLALVKEDGSDSHEYGPSYPPQREDVSYGIPAILSPEELANGEPRYFLTPTPGAPNDTTGVVGFVVDTKFSHDRGFYDAPFEVTVTTETAGATIRYTTDGSVPTEESNGVTYTGPVRISTTTTLRAAAFKADHGPTNVDTHTYIFPADVVRQDGAGFPDSWGGAAADYEMDPDVVEDPAYRNTIENDIVTTLPDGEPGSSP